MKQHKTKKMVNLEHSKISHRYQVNQKIMEENNLEKRNGKQYAL